MNTGIPLWTVLAILGALIVLNCIWDWFCSQYEVTRAGLLPRFARRWYGPRAHVTFRQEFDEHRYVVLAVDDENSAVPWLKVHELDPGSVTYWAEDAEPFWAPVTSFAPYSVRRLRPQVLRYRWLRVPCPFRYLPLRQPAGYLEADA